MTKVCVKCGSSEFSARGDCMPCKRIYDKAYRAANKEKVAESKKKCYEVNTEHYIKKSYDYYHSNKDEIAVKSKIYREYNKAAILEGKRLYRQNNRDKIREAKKEYYERNKEYVNTRQKEYYLRNKEERDAWAKSYRVANSESARMRTRQWLKDNSERAKAYKLIYHKENPEVFANARAVRRVREKTGKLSKGLFIRLLEEQGSTCPGCLIDIDRSNAQMDHFVPLSKGGTNTDNNIQLLCGLCNYRKHATDPMEWLSSLKPTDII